MNLIFKTILFCSLSLIASCTTQDMRVEYSYPKSLDERERERIGSLASEPIYLVREKANKSR